MIPPKGFKATLYPLRHTFHYACGLSAFTSTMNSTMLTLVKNYKGVNAPNTIEVNPKNSGFMVETGAICAPMSIIDKLTLNLRFNLTEVAFSADKIISLNMQWTPIFFSFPEKLDAVDDKSTNTVAGILELTKDATQEDVTPAFGTKLPVDGPSDVVHPTTSQNFTEVFGTLNLTTNTGMEAVPFNNQMFYDALRYYTNRGALKACIGKTRKFTLSTSLAGRGGSVKNFFIKKFVPRAVRRIVPYSFFAILIHVPLVSQPAQVYADADLTSSKAHVGVRATVHYHEWNADHYQEVTVLP